jgi:hypothetical protein
LQEEFFALSGKLRNAGEIFSWGKIPNIGSKFALE